MRRNNMLGALIACAIGSPALAADFTNSNGRLSDTDFYRAVSCKALPKAACAKGLNHWPKEVRGGISVSLVKSSGTKVSSAYAAEANRALSAAIAEVNAVGAGVKLVPYKGPLKALANIRIALVQPKGKARRVKGFTGGNGKPLKVQNAMSLSRTVGSKIIASRIAVAVDRVGQDKLRSIILEEVVQSLGLTWDINNPYYQNRSIFGQVGDDTVTRLRDQDAMALRRHYPSR